MCSGCVLVEPVNYTETQHHDAVGRGGVYFIHLKGWALNLGDVLWYHSTPKKHINLPPYQHKDHPNTSHCTSHT